MLIYGAAGGVGLAAVQLARRRTDRVVGVVGSEAKARFLRERGVTAAMREPPAGPFDVILNPIGGRTILPDLDLLAPLGRIVCYGVSGLVGGEKRGVVRAVRFLLSQPRLKPIGLMRRNVGVMGLNLLRLWNEKTLLARAAWELAAVEGLRPHVDRVFPLSEAAEAHRRLHAREYRQGRARRLDGAAIAQTCSKNPIGREIGGNRATRCARSSPSASVSSPPNTPSRHRPPAGVAPYPLPQALGLQDSR